MAEHESAFAAAVAAVRPLLLGGTIRDAERIVLAALLAANAAGGAELAAANERAEKAEAEAAHLANARNAYDRMRTERDKARARLAELGEAETQQRIVGVNGTSHPATEWDLENRDLWVPGVRLEERQVYAGPWREPADAVQDGRSATETGELQFDASRAATKLEDAQRGTQGLPKFECGDDD